MESYQPPPPPHYIRPPAPAPPSMAADPNFPARHQSLPPPTGSWFSGQFQFHPSQQNQWGPPPPPSYPAHPNAPYATPPPPYPQANQDWGHANWTHHSGWEHPAHSNEDDWAARARAWASARSTLENQPSQSQFTSVGRQEEPSQYSSQYSQHYENCYQDIQQTTISTSGFQNYQAPVAPRPPLVHEPNPVATNSYAPDAHFLSSAKDVTPGRDISASFAHCQGSTSSSVHQQEVPSCYSSVPGKEDGLEGQQHGHSLPHADSRSVHMEQAQFGYGNQSLVPMDHPLEFTQRFGHENDLKMKSSYPNSLGPVIGTDSVAPLSSLHAWTASVAPNVSYPPITPAFPSAPQLESSIGVPPLAGQPVPMFGRGSGFQPAVPSISSPIGLGGGSAPPTAAFPVDAYGASLGTERPKKAAVPNWLKEEIIKKKSAITNSIPEQFKEGIQSTEDDSTNKPTGKGDEADSKSMDSSRSIEEDDDEDYEAQKTAAINQEVKRIVTEVLLKVTNELFDEIATRVLSEDDLPTNGMPDPDNPAQNDQVSPLRPPGPAPNSSAKVLSVKAKESEPENAGGEFSSGSRGNILGLVNYASDDEDDDENQTSSVPRSDSAAGQNGHQLPEAKEHRSGLVYAEGVLNNGNSMGAQSDHVASASKLSDHRMNYKDSNRGNHPPYSRSAISMGKKGDNVTDDESSLKSDPAKSRDDSRRTASGRPGLPTERHDQRKSTQDSHERDARGHDRHDTKRISSGRHISNKIEGSKEREDEEETHGRRDGRHQRKDNIEDRSSLKKRLKDQGGKHREKTRDWDSRKRSPPYDVKYDKKERERDMKTSARDDMDKKRERATDEKGDKFRHKSSDEGRHKRRHFSPIGSRGKQNKENPVVSDNSSDERSEDSRRKVRSRRRDLSPSPVRAKRRQVSRSPPNKPTQRKHSPYSSLDSRRGRSRSRSPVRRHR